MGGARRGALVRRRLHPVRVPARARAASRPPSPRSTPAPRSRAWAPPRGDVRQPRRAGPLPCLLVLVRATGTLSLSGMLGAALPGAWAAPRRRSSSPRSACSSSLLAENSRIPVDDPNTHLELTMIHEVMVLDHGGPDLAFILYGAALKLFLFGAILSRLVLGRGDGALASEGLFFLGVALFAVARRRRRVGDGAAAHRARAAAPRGRLGPLRVRARPPPPVTAMSSIRQYRLHSWSW